MLSSRRSLSLRTSPAVAVLSAFAAVVVLLVVLLVAAVGTAGAAQPGKWEALGAFDTRGDAAITVRADGRSISYIWMVAVGDARACGVKSGFENYYRASGKKYKPIRLTAAGKFKKSIGGHFKYKKKKWKWKATITGDLHKVHQMEEVGDFWVISRRLQIKKPGARKWCRSKPFKQVDFLVRPKASAPETPAPPTQPPTE